MVFRLKQRLFYILFLPLLISCSNNERKHEQLSAIVKNGDYIGALHFIDSVKLDETDSRTLLVLYKCYYGLGEMQESKKKLWLLINKNNDKAEVYFYLGDVSFNMGDLDSAYYYFNKAYSINPMLHDLNYNLAVYYFTTGNDSEALKHINIEIKNGVKTIENHILKGEILVQLNDHSSARQEAAIIGKMDPNRAEKHEIEGMVYYGIKEYPMAAHFFSKAIQMAPQKAILYLRRSRAFYFNGEFQNSLNDANLGISKAPDDIMLHQARLNALISLRMKDSACAEGQVLKKLYPAFNFDDTLICY